MFGYYISKFKKRPFHSSKDFYQLKPFWTIWSSSCDVHIYICLYVPFTWNFFRMAEVYTYTVDLSPPDPNRQKTKNQKTTKISKSDCQWQAVNCFFSNSQQNSAIFYLKQSLFFSFAAESEFSSLGTELWIVLLT